jgi:CBS domain-containing protein
MHAKDVMTTSVVTIGPQAEIPEVARVLLEHRISAIPVVDKTGSILGLVSEGDLMRRAECGSHRSWWLSLLADKTKTYERDRGTRAKDIMTREVVSIDPETTISDIARILESKGIKRVPVIQNGKLVGIVSRADVLRGLAVIGLSPDHSVTVTDREIRERIRDEIRRRTSASLNAVSIIVVSGAVYLWGIADTQADKNAIHIAAENVAGANKVHDFLNTLPEVLSGIP